MLVGGVNYAPGWNGKAIAEEVAAMARAPLMKGNPLSTMEHKGLNSTLKYRFSIERVLIRNEWTAFIV